MIEAVIFDMDGLLIDSEPLWQRAEMEVFRDVGVALGRNDCLQTRGLKIEEVVDYWWTRRPWRGASRANVRQRIVARLIEMVRREGAPKPGVEAVLAFFRARDLPLGLASSSHYVVIEAVLERLGIAAAFRAIHSAQDERLGKPHPDVYRSAAGKLGVEPAHCLAFEDSLAGVRAAKAAGMRCVAVPETPTQETPALAEERPQLGIADLVLDSLAEFEAEHWAQLVAGHTGAPAAPGPEPGR